VLRDHALALALSAGAAVLGGLAALLAGGLVEWAVDPRSLTPDGIGRAVGAAGALAGFGLAARRLGGNVSVRTVLGRLLVAVAGAVGAVVAFDGPTVLLLVAGREAPYRPLGQMVLRSSAIVLELEDLALAALRMIAGLFAGALGGALWWKRVRRDRWGEAPADDRWLRRAFALWGAVLLVFLAVSVAFSVFWWGTRIR
jgi:hypothetical protein